MKHEIKVTTVTQAGNETLGTKEKVLYYLIIGEKPKQIIINVGEKTYNSVNEINTEETPKPIKK